MGYGPLTRGWFDPLDTLTGGWFSYPPPDSVLADFPEALHAWLDLLSHIGEPLVETNPTHTQVHQKLEHEVYATQQKLGFGTSLPSAGKILTGDGAGTSSWQDFTLPAQSEYPFVNEAFLAPAAGQYGLACTRVWGLVPTGVIGGPVMVWGSGRYDSLVSVLVTAWDETGCTYDWWTNDGSTLVTAPTIQLTAYWLW
jgi:hypothetical protein